VATRMGKRGRGRVRGEVRDGQRFAECRWRVVEERPSAAGSRVAAAAAGVTGPAAATGAALASEERLCAALQRAQEAQRARAEAEAGASSSDDQGSASDENGSDSDVENDKRRLKVRMEELAKRRASLQSAIGRDYVDANTASSCYAEEDEEDLRKRQRQVEFLYHRDRVQLAGNVPRSLLTAEQWEEQQRFNATQDAARRQLRDKEQSSNVSRRYRTPWYIPSRLWSSHAAHLESEGEGEDGSAGDGEAAPGAGGTAPLADDDDAKLEPDKPGMGDASAPDPPSHPRRAVDRAAQVRLQLQDLHIRKQYKAFVLSNNGRLPEYLKDCETDASKGGKK
jgi:hypothetical protein